MNQLDVTITRIHPEAIIPVYKTTGAGCFDFHVIEESTIDPAQTKLLRTGLVIQVPTDFVLLIYPRSSLAYKKGLSFPHSVGVIDSDYCGPEDEVKLLVINHSTEPITLTKGDRAGQGKFVPFPRVNWKEVDSIQAPSRGGFGSTGGYTPR